MEKFTGVPVWHASIALHVPEASTGMTSLREVSTWSPSERVRAEQILRHVLRGVGRDVEARETLERSLHLRRLMTVAEAASVGGTQDRR